MTFSGLGYESIHHGEGRWNGVAIISRVGLENPLSGFDDGARTRPRRPGGVGDVRRGPGGLGLCPQRTFPR